MITHFDAGPDDAVHLLFHLRIAALDRIKIELFFVLALELAGGRTAAQTDPIGRAAHLNDQHSFLGFILFDMPGIDLSDAAGEHDRFDPGPALAVLKPLVKGTGKTENHRLAKFVAVIAGSVACPDLDGREEKPDSMDRRTSCLPKADRSRG